VANKSGHVRATTNNRNGRQGATPVNNRWLSEGIPQLQWSDNGNESDKDTTS